MRQETNPPPYFASVNDTCSTVLQGADGLIAGANVLTRPAEEFDNDPSVEALWAMKALEHAEVYFNILCSVDPKLLKLTPHDDNIYKTFREEFPDLKVDILDEEGLKSFEAKQVTEKNRVWNETWNQDCMAILNRCYTGHQQEAEEEDKE
ncbi:protein PBDC1 isoform X4 [Cryptotermes secundus]|uniref:protein PBDC1 isoform X4 n=1 Tax=Cryptotermes secundus TaxID=105785 RepID=UPI001454C876|nr:protein PBDC1 isoform X4 [Cryptotermes secundus]